MGKTRSTPLGGGRRDRLLARGGRVLLAAPSFGWTLLFFLVPLGILLVYSFGQVDVITLNLHFGWTLENYERSASAALDGHNDRFLVYQQRARDEENILRGVLRQLGWSLPDFK